MTTDFYILCAQTVPENYTWDIGTPLLFASNLQDLFSIQDSVSGYAPALNVIFFNNSVSDPEFKLTDYAWDFGDFYNDSNNTASLSCASLVQHTYIMPGTYTVTLRHVQTRTPPDPPLDDPNTDLLCRGKFNLNWYWDKHNSIIEQTSATNLNALTWDKVMCVPPTTATPARPKWWANEFQCLQKYCKYWSWNDLSLSGGGTNPIKWSETETGQPFEKKWMLEANDTVCNISNGPFLNATETIEQTITKTMIVTVKEIPPVANIVSVSATIGSSPFTVQLSPRNCRPGSFPIDRIDWDLGDGTPIKTITRYSLPNAPDIVNTGYFISDPLDVRNIDIVHTYIRNKDTYPVFYPSLTCYSANTSTTDACCITIGPISFSDTVPDLHIIKARNTNEGNLYTFTQNNNIGFVTTTPVTTSAFVPTFTTPPLVIRNSQGSTQNYFGHSNDGNLFPGIYVPQCVFVQFVPTLDYVIVEDPLTYGAQATDEVPVKTEKDFFISP